MSWDDSNFPRADDPKKVRWLILYWRIVPCEGCRDNYRLESRQFDHLDEPATREEAVAKLEEYARNRRESGKQPSIKGLTLFLAEVAETVVISDHTGEIVRD